MKGSHTAPPASWRSRTPNKTAKGAAIASGGRPIGPIPPADPSPPEPPTLVPLPPDPADGPPEPPAGKDEDGEALCEPALDGEGVTATDARGGADSGATLPDADGDPGAEGMGSDGNGSDGLMLGSGIDGIGIEALADGSGSVGIGNVGSGNDGCGAEGNGSDGSGSETEGSAKGGLALCPSLTEPPAVARPRAS